MKPNSIQIGKIYELKTGKGSTTVTVESCDARIHGTAWMCRTAKGSTMSVADPKRFLREIKPKAEKKSLREMIESKGVTIIPKGRRATKTMSDLDDPTFTRKHHVDDNGVLVLEADDEPTDDTPKKKGGKAKGQLSGLESAYVVLKEAGEPLNVKEITDRAIAQKLWEPAGATPAATVAAAIMREMKLKGDESRFYRTERGKFAVK